MLQNFYLKILNFLENCKQLFWKETKNECLSFGLFKFHTMESQLNLQFIYISTVE